MQHDAQYLTAQQTFALQYITVMIIILAFLVGTFSGRSMNKESSLVIAAPAAEVLQPNVLPDEARASLKSSLEYSDLFNTKSGNVFVEKAESIATLLLSHDLIADININLGYCKNEKSDLCFEKEMTAAKNLSDFFLSKGLPYDSFEIFYAPELKYSQARITLQTDRNGI